MTWETKARLYRELIERFLAEAFTNDNPFKVVEDFAMRFGQALDMVDEEESE